ncbi:MAG: elongation factor P [Spirochaetota bacterium]
MISSNEFKRGTVIRLDDNLYSVLEYQHVKPARGAAFVRTKLKSLTKGSIIDKTFRGGEKVEDVRVEKRPMQYLYDEGDGLVFMDNENFEQVSVDRELAGDLMNYIREGDIIDISMHEGDPISIEPPIFVQLEVTYAEPGVKGDTATNVMKNVTVETGYIVQAPLFINEGDILKIDTRNGEYVERVKK